MNTQQTRYWTNASGIEPLQLYDALKGRSPSVLLESTRRGKNGLFSYIALDPEFIIKSRGDYIWVNDRRDKGDPLDLIQKIISADTSPRPEGFPLFYSGAIGYIGYDLKNRIEPKLRTTAQQDTNFWDCYMIVPRIVIAFDHEKLKIHTSVRNSSSECAQRLDEILSTGRIIKRAKPVPHKHKNPVIHTNLSFEQFRAIFDRALEYVRSGDSYQIKISIRHDFNITENPLRIYERLSAINPSPYAAFLDLEGMCLVGCSPEELLRVENRNAQTRPIGGTYPRGKTDEEDKVIANAFYQDEKEVAEHTMLIDLERNDLGRVCELGSVKVIEPMALEKYSYLMHIVTTIEGRLARGKSNFDLVRSMLPGGTVTGCPKIRTMEIIDELEPVARGPYTGSIGFFTPVGDAQFNIIIRTIAIDKTQNKGYIQVGGGIVADSNAQYEYQENLRKGVALVESL